MKLLGRKSNKSKNQGQGGRHEEENANVKPFHSNGRVSSSSAPLANRAESSFSLYDDISLFVKDVDGGAPIQKTSPFPNSSAFPKDGPLMQMTKKEPLRPITSSEANTMNNRSRFNSHESSFSLYDEISVFAKDVDMQIPVKMQMASTTDPALPQRDPSWIKDELKPDDDDFVFQEKPPSKADMSAHGYYSDDYKDDDYSDGDSQSYSSRSRRSSNSIEDENSPTPEINRGSNSFSKLPIPNRRTGSPLRRIDSYDSRSSSKGHLRNASGDSFGGLSGNESRHSKSAGSHHSRDPSVDSSISRGRVKDVAPPIVSNLSMGSTLSSESVDAEDKGQPLNLSQPYSTAKKQSFDSFANYSAGSTPSSKTSSTKNSRNAVKKIAPLAPPSSKGRVPSTTSTATTERHANIQPIAHANGGRHASLHQPARPAGPPRNPSVDMMNRKIHDQAKRHLRLGELDKALQLFEEILNSQRKQYGDVHKLVGAALHNVAIVHVRAKRHKRALTVCREAVEVRRKAQGDKHSDVAQSLTKLGTIYMTLEEWDEAMNAFQEALGIRRHLYMLGMFNSSGNKPASSQPAIHVAQVLSHIGLTYYQLGELLAAVTTFEEVITIFRSECLGDDSSNSSMAEALVNVGTIRTKRQQFDKAIVALEEAMMLQTLEYGDDHSVTLSTMDSLAYSYSKYGSHDNAVDLYQQMLSKQQAQVQMHASQHAQKHKFELECVKTLGKLSIVHEKQGNFCAALDCTSQILQIQRQYLDYDHADLQATKRTFSRIEKKVRMS